MLATLITALFFVVRAFGQLGTNLFHEEPLPYLVYQPLPWQIQCVTQRAPAPRHQPGQRVHGHSLCSLGCLTLALGNGSPDASGKSKAFSDPSEKAAITIQTHFRRYQQQKQEK
ncbi:hypothetical protein N324_12844 [Chlamydotis macqueenii]|nr:hypothetical protein N324_12844 [Chlamydotis macqueenii]